VRVGRHVDALVTQMLVDPQARGSAEQAAKVSATVREQIGDKLRSLLRPPLGGSSYESKSDDYELECRPNRFVFNEVIKLAAPPPAGAAQAPAAAGNHPFTIASSLRMLEIWTMQEGPSLTQWEQDSAHGIPLATLHEVSDSWKRITGGSVSRLVLDGGMLRHSEKWRLINEVFANEVWVSLHASLPAAPDLARDCSLSARPGLLRVTLCWQNYTINIRDKFKGLFSGDIGALRAHPITDSILSSQFATFRSAFTKFKAYARRLHPAPRDSTPVRGESSSANSTHPALSARRALTVYSLLPPPGSPPVRPPAPSSATRAFLSPPWCPPSAQQLPRVRHQQLGRRARERREDGGGPRAPSVGGASGVHRLPCRQPVRWEQPQRSAQLLLRHERGADLGLALRLGAVGGIRPP
jgi:hypothetical protein